MAMLHAVIRVVVFAQIVLVRPQWLCAVGAEAPKQCEPYVKTLFKWNLETKKEDQSIEIEVDDVSIKHIRTLPQNITAVSIMGPYRTGKSFLLNLLTEAKLFDVGDTVRPETEEVRALIIPACATSSLLQADQPGTLMVLDTPGLFAPNRAPIFDAQLLAIVNLMSSVVLFNTFGVIDRGGVEKLSLAMQTASSMAYMMEDESAARGDTVTQTPVAEHTTAEDILERPTLIWNVQNFHLKLVGKDGKETSPAAYIDNYLHEVDHSNANATRFHDQFSKFFRKVDVSMLPYPLDNMNSAGSLSSTAFNDLSKAYREGVVALKDTIRASLRMKRVGRMTLDGDSLADLMQTWAANMNVKLGSFQTSQQDLLSHVQSSKMAAITLEYRHEMDAVLAAPQHKFPISPKQLTAVHQNATSAAMATLTRTDPDFLQAVLAQLQKEYEVYLMSNRQALPNRHKSLAAEFVSVYHDKMKVFSSTDRDAVEPQVLHAIRQEVADQWHGKVNDLDLNDLAGAKEHGRYVTEFERTLHDAAAAYEDANAHKLKGGRDFVACLGAQSPVDATGAGAYATVCTPPGDGGKHTPVQAAVLATFEAGATAVRAAATELERCAHAVPVGGADPNALVSPCAKAFRDAWVRGVAPLAKVVAEQAPDNATHYDTIRDAHIARVQEVVGQRHAAWEVQHRALVGNLSACLDSIDLPTAPPRPLNGAAVSSSFLARSKQCSLAAKSTFSAARDSYASVHCVVAADADAKSGRSGGQRSAGDQCVVDTEFKAAVRRAMEKAEEKEHVASLKACNEAIAAMENSIRVSGASNLLFFRHPQDDTGNYLTSSLPAGVCTGSGVSHDQVLQAYNTMEMHVFEMAEVTRSLGMLSTHHRRCLTTQWARLLQGAAAAVTLTLWTTVPHALHAYTAAALVAVFVFNMAQGKA